MVKVRVLRSGPRGNSTLIWNQDTAILVDCGIGLRIAEKLLKAQGFSLSALSAVLITHSHGDHARPRTIEKLLENKVPVYCSAGVKRVVANKMTIKPGKTVRPFPASVFRVGSFNIKPFPVNHDSPGGCVGYCVYAKNGKVTIKISLATDLGQPDNRVVRHLRNSLGLLLASNHDPEMLRRSDVVPEHVKKNHIIPFHLSNLECAELIVRVAKSSRIKPSFVTLLHISENINTAGKALAISKHHLRKAGHARIAVRPSYSYKASRTSRLGA